MKLTNSMISNTPWAVLFPVIVWLLRIQCYEAIFSNISHWKDLHMEGLLRARAYTVLHSSPRYLLLSKIVKRDSKKYR